MGTSTQWAGLINLKPSMFSGPQGMQPAILLIFDRFVSMVGSQPVILSDYRPNDSDSQHRFGLAIDAYWPGKDPLSIWNLARGAGLFSGLGIYLNDKNVVSFHFDARTDRTPEKPALWGDFISHENGQRKDNYTTAEAVLNVLGNVSSKGLPLILLAAAVYLVYRLSA